MARSKQSGRTHCGCGAVLGSILLAATSVMPSVHAQTLSQPFPCIRWAHSSSLGVPPSGDGDPTSTLYIGMGDAKTTAGQTQNTRTNALVSLDLTSNWTIANPPLQLVQADTGDPYNPPQTSLGAMFPSGDGEDLFYYGGYFSDNPTVEPDAQRLCRYNIPSKEWSPVSTSGDTVTRVAEGASAVTPPTNSGESDPLFYYSFGHLDAYTTQGWSVQTERVYLNSMIEFDQSSNSWNNRTTYSQSGSVSANSTAEVAPLLRADNTLTFVPGLGTDGKGILVSLGGGNANQMIDNSIIDVYDIGAQGWTKQATQGQTIGPRVGHCAVRGSAKVNGVLNHQIFVYGGQASNRTTQILNGQNSDLYVLSIPSFTWTFVGSSLPSQPTGRAAHTCTLMGSEMIVVGGYVSEDLICEQPGVYVLDTSTLTWSTSYTANTTYTTPDHPEIIALAGGRGTGSSTAGSGYAIGTGANDTDTSADFEERTSSGGGKSSTGAIAGGVVGGLIALAIIAGLIFFFLRKKKKAAAAAAEQEKEKKALAASSHGDSPGSMAGNPYEDYAPDDVEDRTAGYNAQFSHLVPRQTLRVVNA